VGDQGFSLKNILSSPMALTGPSNLDRAVFCRQFATLSTVGIPVLKALKMLSNNTQHSRLRQAIAATARGVEEGQSIHQAMASNVHVFTPLVVSIVRVGELGGILEESLVRLAEIMESKERIRRRVVAAIAYPVVALCVAFGVVTVVLTKAIPVFADVYKTAGHELPRITRILIALSDVFVHGWWAILILVAGAIVGLNLWGRTGGGALFYSWLFLRVPILSMINRKIATARLSRSLGGLLRAGIPLTDALLITADSSENLLVADALRDVHRAVETGERMSGPLAAARVLPPMVTDMIAVGEETGTLDQMLDKVSDIFEEDVDATLAGLASIIEPLLILVLGGIVVFIALGVLLPYFKLATVIGSGD
jgi:type IV pilus assembly protein PilC